MGFKPVFTDLISISTSSRKCRLVSVSDNEMQSISVKFENIFALWIQLLLLHVQHQGEIDVYSGVVIPQGFSHVRVGTSTFVSIPKGAW